MRCTAPFGGAITPQALRENTQQSERVHSHTIAFTSLRCGFQCVHEIFKHGYQEWLLELGYIKGFIKTSFFAKLMPISSSKVKHIIGWAEALFASCRVFASVADTKRGTLLTLVGRPHACLLTKIMVDLILEGENPIMESFVEHGF